MDLLSRNIDNFINQKVDQSKSLPLKSNKNNNQKLNETLYCGSKLYNEPLETISTRVQVNSKRDMPIKKDPFEHLELS